MLIEFEFDDGFSIDHVLVFILVVPPTAIMGEGNHIFPQLDEGKTQGKHNSFLKFSPISPHTNILNFLSPTHCIVQLRETLGGFLRIASKSHCESHSNAGIIGKKGREMWGLATVYSTVKGQSRSDSLLLSPYHWAKLFRGVVAIVAVPMRFAVIC